MRLSAEVETLLLEKGVLRGEGEGKEGGFPPVNTVRRRVRIGEIRLHYRCTPECLPVTGTPLNENDYYY